MCASHSHVPFRAGLPAAQAHDRDGGAEARREGAAHADGPGGSARERLLALLDWAQLMAEEEAQGEAAWEAWECDAEWLALLQQY